MRLMLVAAVGLFLLSYTSDNDKFLMPVEDVFSITGRGPVVTGVIERGKIKIGDSVEFVGLSEQTFRAKVIGIELSRSFIKEAEKGNSVGLLLSGVDKSKIERGMVVAEPGTIKAYHTFSCQITLLKKEEGGRSTALTNNARALFQLRHAAVSGEINFLVGDGKIEPGSSTSVIVKLAQPVALEKDQPFEIKEGSRIVGRGTVKNVVK